MHELMCTYAFQLFRRDGNDDVAESDGAVWQGSLDITAIRDTLA